MEKLTQKIIRLLYISFLMAVLACTSDHKQQAFAQETTSALKGKHLGHVSEYKNLKIYLIEGAGTLNNKQYLTLDQAMEKKKATVIETGNVNELSIDNLSGDYIFIHSGDIVKGGQQDRTIGNDMIIEPNAKKVKMPSFCVEHSRWSKRGNENVKEFSSSKNMLPSKELKIASRYKNNQQEVWDKVEAEQEKYKTELSKKANRDVEVKSAQSSTSLQLALENDSLLKSKNEYLSHLKTLLQNNSEAIGMAVYINNELSEINIYNNHALFRELSAKLLDAAILEAISEGEKTNVNAPADAQLKQMLSVTEQADTSYANEVNKATRITTVANKMKQVLLFETEDQKEQKCLHYNYLKTDEKTFITNNDKATRPRYINRVRTR
jgi:hypothetical protein